MTRLVREFGWHGVGIVVTVVVALTAVLVASLLQR